MTEAWKSTPHFFCEICKVWMNDNPQARAVHEKGMKHQENLARKLRDMRHKADNDKRSEALAVRTMAGIEARAKRQYEEDLKAQSSAREELTGKWENDAESGHLYNARHRYYYDKKTKMYYGGDPPAWTVQPSIPPEAKYREEAAGIETPSTTGTSPAAKKFVSTRPGTTKGTKSHPLANIGGYQMPMVGRIGGNTGLIGGKSEPTKPTEKRPRDSSSLPKKEMSKEEEEAIKRREAARARVQQRTMNAFGLS